MGLAKHLKRGRLIVDEEKEQIEMPQLDIVLPFRQLSNTDWGQIYEKFVGQALEDEGYTVEYSGLKLGFFDSGIDLIATKDSESLFIQCKLKKAKFSKAEIELILYKASRMLANSANMLGKKITFMLVVNSKDNAFGKKVKEKNERNIFSRGSLTYPLLQYFLSHNETQNKVIVAFREIRMLHYTVAGL